MGLLEFGRTGQATQIRNGAPADVFASANTEIPALLYSQGFVEQPVDFTRNTLVIVVPKSNPAGLASIFDLAKPGVKLAVAAPAVPVGAYTLQILKQMGLTSKVLPNVVTQESDVRSVLAKVALGQADAGFVYSTDARTAASDVQVLRVPAWAQPKVVYAMAVVSKSSNKAAAQAFIDKVLSKQGQATFAQYGFLALPGASAPGTIDAKVKLVERSARVRRGAKAFVTVAFPTKRACTVRVVDVKGHTVRATGLVAKQPTAAGRITWRWTVPARMTPGRSSIRVTCGAAVPALRTSVTVVR